MSEKKEDAENFHKNPVLVNNPNEVLPQLSWPVYNFSQDAQGAAHINHIGNVQGADLAEAHGYARQRWGFNGYDYIRPVGEFPATPNEKKEAE
jgi:hypothetical protein